MFKRRSVIIIFIKINLINILKQIGRNNFCSTIQTISMTLFQRYIGLFY